MPTYCDYLAAKAKTQADIHNALLSSALTRMEAELWLVMRVQEQVRLSADCHCPRTPDTALHRPQLSLHVSKGTSGQ